MLSCRPVNLPTSAALKQEGHCLFSQVAAGVVPLNMLCGGSRTCLTVPPPWYLPSHLPLSLLFHHLLLLLLRPIRPWQLQWQHAEPPGCGSSRDGLLALCSRTGQPVHGLLQLAGVGHRSSHGLHHLPAVGWELYSWGQVLQQQDTHGHMGKFLAAQCNRLDTGTQVRQDAKSISAVPTDAELLYGAS